MKCKIQWINDKGQPTPDENEAIGKVRTLPHDSVIAGRTIHFDGSEWFPICSKHLEEYYSRQLYTENWEYVSF